MLDLAAPSAVLYLEVSDLRGRDEQLRGRGVVIEDEPHVIFGHQDDSLGPAGAAERHLRGTCYDHCTSHCPTFEVARRVCGGDVSSGHARIR